MDKESLKLGSVFFKEKNLIDYQDNDIILIEDMKYMPSGETIKLDMIFILLCVEGKMRLSINGKEYEVLTGDIIICSPNVYLNDYLLSPNFKSKILGLSYSALQRSLQINKEIWDLILYVVKHPVFHLNEDALRLIENYYAVVQQKIQTPPNAFHKEIMFSLFQSVYYEIFAIIKDSIQQRSVGNDMNRADYLFKRFLELLYEYEGKERSVSFYADKMCISPKYLSMIVRSASGKSALEWIHEYTIKSIIRQLKHTDKSIKEIADELNFPNMSFFGKFVKSQVGVPPKEYRRLSRNTEV